MSFAETVAQSVINQIRRQTTPIRGSSLSTRHFNIFGPVPFPVALIVGKWAGRALFAQFSAAIKRNGMAINDMLNGGNKIDELRDIQLNSNELLTDLIKISGSKVELSGSKEYELDIVTSSGAEKVNGVCDAALDFDSIRLAVLESKVPKEDVNNAAHKAQTCTQVDAAANSFRKRICGEPCQMCGIVANGRDFLLLNRYYKDGDARWSSCGPCNRFTHLDEVTALFMEYFSVLKTLTSTVVAYQETLAHSTHDNDGSGAEYGEDGRSDGVGGGGSGEGLAGDGAGGDRKGSAGGGAAGTGKGLAGGGAAVSRAEKSGSAIRHGSTGGWSSGTTGLTVINLQKHDQALVWKSLCI